MGVFSILREAGEVEKSGRCVTIVDVGVNHSGVGTRHIGASWVLNPELVAEQCKGRSFDCCPDFLLSRFVRVRLTKSEGVDRHCDDTLNNTQAICWREQLFNHMRPVARGSSDDIWIRLRRRALTPSRTPH